MSEISNWFAAFLMAVLCIIAATLIGIGAYHAFSETPLLLVLLSPVLVALTVAIKRELSE